VIILPLIERELRVRARSRSVYWTRFAVALVGILICLPALTMADTLWGGVQAAMGASVFNGLVGAAFLLCCCAGFLAVDGISRERREGTLGLLFLTRVTAFDVLLGSFGAVGVTCLCALLAFLPMLILPLLIGGVTGGEAARTVLVLFDTLFLSLAVGLWAAAWGRSWLDCARQAALLLVLLVLVPDMFALLTGFAPLSSGLALISPLSALAFARDSQYRAGSVPFWSSIAWVHGVSWLLLIAAGNQLRRAMRGDDRMLENSAPAGRKARGEDRPPKTFALYRWNIPLSRSRRREPIADGVDPIVWLLRGMRGVKSAIWTAVLFGAIYYVAFYSLIQLRGPGSLSYFPSSLPISIVQGSLFAWAASRFFVEARRTGELELLLTTPAGAAGIVSSQWIWLRRMLFWPVVLLVAPTLGGDIWSWVQFRAYLTPVGSPTYYLIQQLSNEGVFIVNTIIGVVALFWVGIWFGFKARSQAGAIIRTLVLAKGAPYLIARIGSLLISSLHLMSGSPFRPWFRLPQAAILLYYLWLWRWARRRLRAELGHSDAPRFQWAETLSRLFSAKAIYK
jgi:ABC-type transport system involved in multi-copper enzyme maturation permease subunit